LAGQGAGTYPLQHLIVQQQHEKRRKKRGMNECAARRGISVHGAVTCTVQGGSCVGMVEAVAAPTFPDELRSKLQFTVTLPPALPSSERWKSTAKRARQSPFLGAAQLPVN